jgi:putative SOS response-associated peptidase YedK
MCIEYELRTDAFQSALPFFRQEMPLIWAGPEPDALKYCVRVGNRGAVVKRDGEHLVGEMLTWGWEEGRQIIFNRKSEGKDFPGNQRALILASGCYEYTEPMEPRILGHERHFFAMKGEAWFAIAGIAMGDCFSLLTTQAGPDIRRYRRRQACVLSPSAGLEWLRFGHREMLQPGDPGTMSVRTFYGAKTFAIPASGSIAMMHARPRQKSGPAAAE